MHHQRIAAFLLGAWILGSLFMIFVATQNFGMADQLGDANAHAALRNMAGRLNQLFFMNWERVELALGIALFAVALLGMRNRVLAVLAATPLVLVAIQHLFVTPEMITLSAQLDTSALQNQFAKLHATYGIMEVVKLVLTFALAVLLLPSWRGRRGSGVQVQPVDYAHHSHVDG